MTRLTLYIIAAVMLGSAFNLLSLSVGFPTLGGFLGGLISGGITAWALIKDRT
jgi:hypothetical protein